MNELKNNKMISADNSQPNNLDELDFSIKNHAKEAFSCLIVNSVRSVFFSITKNFLHIVLALVCALLICCCSCWYFLRFSSIENSLMNNLTKTYISDFTGRTDIEIQKTKLAFDPDHKQLAIYIDGLLIGKVKMPKITIFPDCLQSIFKGKLIIKNIKLNNTKFKLKAAKDLKAISIGAGNNSQKFFPFRTLSKICDFIGPNTGYLIDKANVLFLLDDNKFKLNNFKCSYNTSGLNTTFNTKLSPICSPSIFDIKIANNGSWKANIDNVVIKELSKILDKNNEHISPIARFLKNYNVPVSGDVGFSVDNQSGFCNLVIGSGTYKNMFSSPYGDYVNSWSKIKSGQLSATYKNNTIVINKMNIKADNTDIHLSGITIPLIENKYGMIDINGTIELKDIGKKNIGILPKSMINACLMLFEKNIPGFKLNSLKMDMSGSLNLNDKFAENNIKITHGVFAIENGTLRLGNGQLLTNVIAMGEILDDKTKLAVTKAKIGELDICSGNVQLNKHGAITGHISVAVPLSKLANLDRLNNVIPFDSIETKNNMLQVTVNVNNARELTFLTKGHAVIESKSGHEKLNISWDEKQLLAKGNAKIKNGGTISLDVCFNDKTQIGHKKIAFSGNGSILGFYNPLFKNACNGDIEFNINENWKANIGDYAFKIDIKNGLLKLPFIGAIGGNKATIKGSAIKTGDVLNFSDISIISNQNKIDSKLIYNTKTDEILALKVGNLKLKNDSLKLDFYKRKNNMYLTVFADNVDISNLVFFIDKLKKNIDIHTSINLASVKVSDLLFLKKVQGTLKIRDGKVIQALCASVLSDNSKVLIKTKDEHNNIITEISTSNAGAILKDLGIMQSVIGGKLKAVMAGGTDKGFSVNCELTDIIIRGNDQLSKLVSLTIPNCIQDLGRNIGFNGIVFSLAINDNSIVISDGRAIGPTICASFDGSYDRIEDSLAINGVSVPVLLNNTTNKSIYAPYKISGSFNNPEIAVNPLAASEHDVLSEIFGINLQQNKSEDTTTEAVTTNDGISVIKVPDTDIKPDNNSDNKIEEDTAKIIDLEEAPTNSINNKPKIRSKKKNIKNNSTIEHGIKVERYAR